jgi:plastocyanin
MRRSNLGIGFVGLLLAAAGFSVAAIALRPASAAGSAQARRATSVTVTATEFKFKLSRRTAPVGTVVFHVQNKGRLSHDFKIHGKKTAMIKPGKSATLRIVFSKKGRYAYLCTVPGHAAAGMKGVLGVGVSAPAPSGATMPTTTAPTTTTTPATTTTPTPGAGATVQVSMYEFGFTLSPTTVPSGPVTFVMKNTGSTAHNFDLQGVQVGPLLDPGETASMTVNLEPGRTYSYLCDVPEHADAGMQGTFTTPS